MHYKYQWKSSNNMQWCMKCKRVEIKYKISVKHKNSVHYLIILFGPCVTQGCILKILLGLFSYADGHIKIVLIFTLFGYSGADHMLVFIIWLCMEKVRWYCTDTFLSGWVSIDYYELFCTWIKSTNIRELLRIFCIPPIYIIFVLECE